MIQIFFLIFFFIIAVSIVKPADLERVVNLVTDVGSVFHAKVRD